MIDGLRDLFTHNVMIEPWTGQNEYGAATHGTAISYRAHIERGSRQAVMASGDQGIVPQFKVFIPDAVQVDVRDRITLPVAFGARNDSGVFVAPSPIIRQVQPVFDEIEQVCTIIHCG